MILEGKPLGNSITDKLSVYINFCKDLSGFEKLDLIERAGFDGVMLSTDDDNFNRFCALAEYSLDKGLFISCVHLPFNGEGFTANDIWREESFYFDKLVKTLMLCGKYNIGAVVMHLTCGSHYPEPNSKGFKRIGALCELALSHNVAFALENKRNSNHIDEVLSNVDSPALALCYDTGHEEIYEKGCGNIERHSAIKPIARLHLHDNFGQADEHMLPFEGGIDFDKVLNKLARANFSGDILLEPRKSYSPLYDSLTNEQYIQRAYRRASEFRDKLIAHRCLAH